ncbi:MAG: hypothetical protein COZ70_14730 [Deltaproteobacteria bacterium CG_4_8_14_3_um_filter_51_11]|nr:hypothetical protein [bacterium]OIP43053.1 MAG: hypothetical protein AUK25_02325 [Desulfobacteraceae bacterium CG2_30_51_40]PIP46937.1 MAG: hypothetical protein COX16_07100 [Deltaproteobacteria bacterium CG23_combo_of_CG06-09_8_20_14_all_51_20]PIX18339.1 MAG: hypothetical protein COZ70_14730 [Deltaproteobacteria bacterium CG_4_8_14_3_um_filter_51_11]PIY26419.1 MAG: hypothetical protein COZ11_02705 [Deltaproteobacteria bacterium CG_4_10_14_3_um_filter_51_14]PJB37102.1 MAG: hypothetical prote
MPTFRDNNLERCGYDLSVANCVFHLNYRLGLQALCLWRGDAPPFKAYELYEGFEDFLSIAVLDEIDEKASPQHRQRLRHGVIDHYLQRAILPHETEMRTWMRGAAGHVEGKKIYFRDIIAWCQKQSTIEGRRTLQKETGPLCKFLKPFALNSWKTLLAILKEELGFEGYLEYCSAKKGLNYRHYYVLLKDLLKSSDDIYFPAMERWCRKTLGRCLGDLTRFDSIYLLGLGEFDRLFPPGDLRELPGFFSLWGMDPALLPGLTLELGAEEGKSGQAMCFVLDVPGEIYVLIKPEGGWVDLEALWHELGHGIASALTSSEIGMIEKDLGSSFCLSEAFAFLVQNTAMSFPFLTKILGLKEEDAENIRYYKTLKDMSIFRRYAAKFISEYEMFSGGDLENGDIYARNMARYTGFYYQPESHLFDLVPEFYSLDYVLAWMAEAAMQNHLCGRLGPEWPLAPEAGTLLSSWWMGGSQRDLSAFMAEEGLGAVSYDSIMSRWKETLGP